MKTSKRYISSLVFVIFLSLQLSAQTKTTTHVEQVWLAYFNQTRFSDKWGMWADLHLRTKEDFFTNFSTGIIRLGLTYYLNTDAKFTLGYAYVNHFPGGNHKNISQPEHRPWQQFQWHTNYPKLKLMQYIRLEERYVRKVLNDVELADGYNFNFRVRYNFFSQFPIGKKRFQPGSFSFVLNDEIHINFGEEIVYNTFDQNRFFLGFQYQLANNMNLQFGYLNQFVQTSSGNEYRSINAARIFLLHNIDARKKK